MGRSSSTSQRNLRTLVWSRHPMECRCVDCLYQARRIAAAVAEWSSYRETYGSDPEVPVRGRERRIHTALDGSRVHGSG